MTLNRGAQRAIVAIFFTAVAVIYTIQWRSPAIGLFHDDGMYLVTAKSIAAGHGYIIESLPRPIPQTKYPPVFPAVLALFVLVSQQPQWLKLLPLLCTAGWLALTRILLIRLGASPNSALLIVGLTAASPTVVMLGTNLFSESLFALLFTAALLMFLRDQPLAAGVLAGLATLTRAAGLPLIAACILILVARRRLRSAAVFAVVPIVMAAPWFGWSLANVPRDTYDGSDNYVASNIISSFAANEKLTVLTHNFMWMLASPISLLTGFSNVYTVIFTALAIGICMFIRRQLLPDLAVALYCLMLLCLAWPPERFVAPLLPLILWMVWRVAARLRAREALTAVIAIVVALTFWADVRGVVAPVQNNWSEMRRMFDSIRTNTSQNSVILANLDPAIYLNTGRKTVRGFAPDGFGLYYASRQTGVTPDRLSASVIESQVNYVVLSPDRNLGEAPSFRRSVEALERGGILQPVALSGDLPGYRLLHVAQTGY